MKDITTITVDRATKDKISKMGRHNESFDSLLNHILSELSELKKMAGSK